MRRLQNLPEGAEYVVTLGAGDRVDPALVVERMVYEHPVHTPASAAAQKELPRLNTPVTAYAGAWHGWGFHEDGCRSGVAAAGALVEVPARRPWSTAAVRTGVRRHGIHLLLRGLPVQPRPPYVPQKGMLP